MSRSSNQCSCCYVIDNAALTYTYPFFEGCVEHTGDGAYTVTIAEGADLPLPFFIGLTPMIARASLHVTVISETVFSVTRTVDGTAADGDFIVSIVGGYSGAS